MRKNIWIKQGSVMMTTEKLYYQDPYIKSFSARILQCKQDEKGRFYVVLDRTAFYPTGGGQPYDTGTINDVHVFDVEEEKGEIRHFIESPLEEKECHGEIDWDRRFDHMQQHAGQHILSAAFEDMYGYKTVGFHLGAEICTIDLEVSALTEEEANRSEEQANTVILENRPIKAIWVTEEELSKYPLRKPISFKEDIRLVIIPDFDYNGCGGTHPTETGQIGSMKILHWEKEKKNIRVSFVCGNRVLKQLQDKHHIIQRLTALLNAPQSDLEGATIRILEKEKELEKSKNELKEELLAKEADQLMEEAIIMKNYKLVKKIFHETPMTNLQKLANNVTQNSDKTLVLFINEKDNKFQIVCARSKDINFNMKEFIEHILPKINGKGGGSEWLVQGGGDKVLSAKELLEEMVQTIE